MRRVAVIVAALCVGSVAWGQGVPRTPNLALKFTRDTTTNDNFVRLDDVLGTITDYPHAGVVDRGGQVFNVKAYGAKGDGTTDDTTAIQAAITAAANGGVVFLPCGQYVVTSTLTFTGVAKSLVGCGTTNNVSGASKGTAIRYSGTGYALSIGGATEASHLTVQDLSIFVASPASGAVSLQDQARFVRFQQMYLEGYNQTTPIAFDLTGQTSCNCFHEFDQVQVKTFLKGWRFSGYANANMVTQGHCQNTPICFDFSKTGSDTSAGDDNVVERSECNGGTGTCVRLKDTADRNVFIRVTADGSTSGLDAADASDTVMVACNLPSPTYSSTAADDIVMLGMDRGTGSQDGKTLQLGASSLKQTSSTILQASGSFRSSKRYYGNTDVSIITGDNTTSKAMLERNDASPMLSCLSSSLGCSFYGDVSFNTSNVNFFPPPTTHANLGTPSNGAMRYCSDCTIANPCASGGTGAIAKRLNGAWVCN